MTSNRNPRPLIGLTGRRKTGAEIVDNPAVLHDLDGDYYYSAYSRAVFEAGGLPVNLPIDVDPAHYADRLDGFLLSGGADMNPQRYGAEVAPETESFDNQRDEFELGVLTAAYERELPVLGICRGAQVINVHGGGTLDQHVPEHQAIDKPVDTHSHRLTITEGTTLRSLVGTDLMVNSLHHQTIAQVGDDLRVVATAEDGVVEALEHRKLPVLAVQWHPEMLATRSTDPIFDWLVSQASLALSTV